MLNAAKPLFRTCAWITCCFLLTGVTPRVSAETVLTLYTWEEYISPALLQAFHEETGIRVKEVHYQTDETKNEVLLATEGGRGFDLLVASGFTYLSYVEAGWVLPLPTGKMTQLGQIHPRWRDYYPAVRDFVVPYFWGTLGIGWRKDLHDGPVTSWRALLRPTESLRGRILMLNDPKETVGIALLSLGYRANSTVAAEVQQAEEVLLAQRPYVQEYGYADLGSESSLVRGDTVMTMLYNGDALVLADYNDQIRYVVPAEGTILWVDYMGVLRQSAHPDEAFRFIDFINRPRMAAANARHVMYASPNRGAEKLLPAEFRSNPVIYPPEEVILRSESAAGLDAHALSQRNRIFSKLLK